ncbi:MAG: hypothetical protein HKM04_08640 [Legionellales bacterium]|nr:hypothetical protein [Legionellales bacterium]
MNTLTAYHLHDETDVESLKQELGEQIHLTSSLIKTLWAELSGNINDRNHTQLLVLFEKQMQEVETQHDHFCSIVNKDILFINEPAGTGESQQVTFTESIYILNSMSHVLYQVLDDEVEDHLLNLLSVVKKCTKKMVGLVDEVNVKIAFR